MMMERGYLLILISAGISAFFALTSGGVVFWGYLLLAAGIYNLPTSPKELRIAHIFTFAGLIMSLRFWLPLNWLLQPHIHPFLSLLQLFFGIGIFFWILKAEYIWSPHRGKRINLYMYSGISLIYLLISIITAFPTVFTALLPFGLWINLLEFSPTIGLIYHGILLYILGKLYFEARRHAPGLKRWH